MLFRNAVKRVSALSLALLLSTASLIYGQENKGKVLGTITDASGGVVAGVKLSAVSDVQPTPITVMTDSNGRFIFGALSPGMYTVTITKEGFQTTKLVNVDVRLGSQVDLNAKLVVGMVAQTVEVTESAQSLDVTSARTAVNITRTELEKLPTGRSFNTLLGIAPGVRQETKNGTAGVGGYQVDGASGSENSFVIDGVDVTDVRSGALRQQNAIPPEFIQEIEVKSSGFEAQYGGATGGVINVVTRPGANDFHGQFMLQFQNNQMVPRPRGYYKRSPLSANVADFFSPNKDTFRTFWPGGIINGKLIKDKVFFTAGYLPSFVKTERIVRYGGTVGTKISNKEDTNHYFLSRVDINPSAKLQLNTSYFWTPQRQKGVLLNVDPRIAAPSNDLTVQGGWQPSTAYTASANYAVNSTFLLSARYGYKYQNDKNLNYGLAGAPYNIYRTASTAAGLAIPAEVAGGNGYTNVSSTFGTLYDQTIRHNVYLDASKIASFKGQQHTFKFGYQLARVGNNVKDDYANGQFDIFWGDSFSRGPINNAKGTYGYYIWQDGVRHDNKVNGRNQGFYLQDTWRVSKKLTLNLGARFENEFLPPYTPTVNGKKIANPVAFGWGDKIAPRIGVAYDILGDGKWKLSGSYGLFYDVMKYELARGSFGGDFWVSHVYLLNSPNVLSLGKASPGALGTEVTKYDNRSIPINAQGELDGIDPNIKPMTSRRFNVTLEHQLASRLNFSVRYTRNDVLKGIEDIGVLDTDGSEVYLIGNPGFGETRNTKSVYGAKTPNGKEFLVPEAKRQYDAVEFRVYGTVAKTNLLASYTLSRLYGNWSGLANSDESGRSQPGVSRAFDLPYYYFDASGSQKNVYGRLATDRPHEIKLFLNRDFVTKMGSTNFGLSQSAFSGSLDSTSVIYLSAPTYPLGRGDLGRTPFLTQTDFAVSHTVKLSERTSVKFEANAINVFNQATQIARVSQINRAGAITEAALPLNTFFAGYDVKKFVFPANGGASPYNPIYGLAGGNYRAGGSGAFQAPRDLRVGVRLLF